MVKAGAFLPVVHLQHDETHGRNLPTLQMTPGKKSHASNRRAISASHSQHYKCKNCKARCLRSCEVDVCWDGKCSIVPSYIGH